MVFAGVYPFNQSETKEPKAAIERLTLNDRSVSVNKETSLALGQGWRLGFLGILHMEVFTQRLEQEFDADHHFEEISKFSPSISPTESSSDLNDFGDMGAVGVTKQMSPSIRA